MLGLLYIPKYRGEKQPFQIGKVVNIVFGELCNRDPSCPFGIIMSPGYMSTTKNTIQEYIDKFFKHNHCHFYTYANKLGVTCCTKSFHWLKSKFIQ